MGFTAWLLTQDLSELSAPLWHSFLVGVLEFLQNAGNLLWYLLVFGITLTLLGHDRLIAIIRDDPDENWEWVRFFVEQARERAYEELESNKPSHHRVTLYKYCRVLPKGYRHWTANDPDVPGWLPEFLSKRYAQFMINRTRSGDHPIDLGWLVPVMRAQHEDSVCVQSTVFAAAENHELYEGVAAQAWEERATIAKPGLPSVNYSNKSLNRTKYGLASFCDRKLVDFMLEKGNVAATNGQPKELPKTIGAITLINDQGEGWGVLVFDSRDPDAFPNGVNDGAALNALFKTTTKGLSKALR